MSLECGKMISAYGKLSPACGKLSPACGKLSPACGKMTSAHGKIVSAVTEMILAVGKIIFPVTVFCGFPGKSGVFRAFPGKGRVFSRAVAPSDGLDALPAVPAAVPPPFRIRRQAFRCSAAALKVFAQAVSIAAKIPIPAVRKTAQMQNLLAQAKAPEVIAKFADEDIAKWPFWKRGDGYLARGRAQVIAKDSKQATADLTRALEWLSDARARKSAEDLLAGIPKQGR